MPTPKILVMSGYGLNCEEETKFAFEKAGGTADIVHINDVIAGSVRLQDYQILAIPGGFSYGDDTGSGRGFANRIRNNVWEQVKAFVDKDKLVIGICNGCQVLTNLGLVPALDRKYGEIQVALEHNESARYFTRWVDLQFSDSPWTKGLGTVSVPMAHGEGRVYADTRTLHRLRQEGLIAAKYVAGEISRHQGLPANPNGSIDDIAALTDETGKVLAIMPHPERAIDFTQLPHWTLLKEQLQRKGKPLPTDGPGLKIFENGVRYFG